MNRAAPQQGQADYAPSMQILGVPENWEARAGRSNRHNVPEAPESPLSPPCNALDVKVALGRIMADVMNGKLDTKIATTATYASMALLKALETSDLESRVAALEAKTNDLKK